MSNTIAFKLFDRMGFEVCVRAGCVRVYVYLFTQYFP